jgi:UDP-N-acetylmuramoyl-tripeptide--D-alanyl-D-alanine ligase
MIWTSKQLSQALSVKFTSKESFGIVQFNSKDVQPGDVFIALTGGARDGHEFVADALAQGAGLAIVSKDIKGVPESKIIKVKDTFEALHDLAEYKRQNSKAKFIGITGSVGKTTTKEVVSLMLESFGKTFTSRNNFNNEIGVPINLASISDDDEFVVMEMGMRGPGQIAHLTAQVTPDIAIVTSVAQGHLEFFKSVEAIADAKCEIFEGLDINEGVAILNRDISTYKRCMENIDTVGVGNIKTFGKSQFANVRFASYTDLGDGKVKLSYIVYGEKIEVIMPMLPKHMAINFAAAFAVVRALGLDVGKAAQALVNFKMKISRGKIIDVKKDSKEYSIITDYYNANPESMKAGLEYLGLMKNSKKIAILGDMKELGKDEVKIHLAAIPHIVKSGATKLFLVGDIMSKIASDVPKTIEVYRYKNSSDLAKEINRYIEGGEVILIKASRGIHLEYVAESLGVVDAL